MGKPKKKQERERTRRRKEERRRSKKKKTSEDQANFDPRPQAARWKGVFLYVPVEKNGTKMITMSDGHEHILPVFSSRKNAKVAMAETTSEMGITGFDIAEIPMRDFLGGLLLTFPSLGITRLLFDGDPIPLSPEGAEWADSREEATPLQDPATGEKMSWGSIPPESFQPTVLMALLQWAGVPLDDVLPPRESPRVQATKHGDIGGKSFSTADQDEVNARMEEEGMVDLSNGTDPYSPGTEVIVKVQRAFEKGAPLLVYDEYQRIHMMIDENRLPRLTDLMSPGGKVYVWASAGDDTEILFDLDRECLPQDW